MRAVFSFALVLLAQSVSCGTLEAQTGSPVALERARILIAGSEHEKAAAVLEEAIETASPSDKPALVGLLRQSYRSLIDQAEAAGKSRQAAEYRENLAILDQTPIASGGKPQENASQREVRVATQPAGSSDSSPPAQLPRRSDLHACPDHRPIPIRTLSKSRRRRPTRGVCLHSRGPVLAGTTRPGTPHDWRERARRGLVSLLRIQPQGRSLFPIQARLLPLPLVQETRSLHRPIRPSLPERPLARRDFSQPIPGSRCRTSSGPIGSSPTRSTG